ncbi:MAG: hypothetical protein LBK91_02370 [Synergistaceae bacterium]|nr:hypothetical protein [Synergistaceae bacterium]
MKILGKILLLLAICVIAGHAASASAYAVAPCGRGVVIAAPPCVVPIVQYGGFVTSSVTVLPVTTAIAYAPYAVTVYPTVAYPAVVYQSVVYPSPVVLPRIVTVPTYAVIR